MENYLEHSITQASLIHDFSAEIIAQHLSLVDCEMLKKIEVGRFCSFRSLLTVLVRRILKPILEQTKTSVSSVIFDIFRRTTQPVFVLDFYFDFIVPQET